VSDTVSGLRDRCPETGVDSGCVRPPGNLFRTSVHLFQPRTRQLQHQLSSRQQNAIDTMRSLTAIRHPRVVGLLARSRRNGISQSRWNSTQPPSPEPNQTSPHVCFSSRMRKYTANRYLGWLLQDIRTPHSKGSPYGHVYISISILGVGKTRKG
jgi:hypothetical protein